jgi:hypothetical protein
LLFTCKGSLAAALILALTFAMGEDQKDEGAQDSKASDKTQHTAKYSLACVRQSCAAVALKTARTMAKRAG